MHGTSYVKQFTGITRIPLNVNYDYGKLILNGSTPCLQPIFQSKYPLNIERYGYVSSLSDIDTYPFRAYHLGFGCDFAVGPAFLLRDVVECRESENRFKFQMARIRTVKVRIRPMCKMKASGSHAACISTDANYHDPQKRQSAIRYNRAILMVHEIMRLGGAKSGAASEELEFQLSPNIEQMCGRFVDVYETPLRIRFTCLPVNLELERDIHRDSVKYCVEFESVVECAQIRTTWPSVLSGIDMFDHPYALMITITRGRIQKETHLHVWPYNIEDQTPVVYPTTRYLTDNNGKHYLNVIGHFFYRNLRPPDGFEWDDDNKRPTGLWPPDGWASDKWLLDWYHYTDESVLSDYEIV